MKKQLLLLVAGMLLFPKAYSQVQSTMYLDFGLNDAANATTNPDASGNYWNTIPNSTGENERLSLIDSRNAATGITVKVNPGFSQNSVGLSTPSAELLGDFAIPTATRDFFFVSTGTGSITISGLDQNKYYLFQLFGTRNDSETRITQYKLTGKTENAVTLQTSGAGSGTGNTPNYTSGNDNRTVRSAALQPDASGSITLEVSKTAGSFGYLTLMKIEAHQSAPLGLKKDKALDSEVMLYPNPSAGELNFSSSRNLTDSDVSIFDGLGRAVYKGHLKDAKIDVSSLSPGVYTLLLMNDKKVIQKRFVKQ